MLYLPLLLFCQGCQQNVFNYSVHLFPGRSGYHMWLMYLLCTWTQLCHTTELWWFGRSVYTKTPQATAFFPHLVAGPWYLLSWWFSKNTCTITLLLLVRGNFSSNYLALPGQSFQRNFFFYHSKVEIFDTKIQYVTNYTVRRSGK